MLNIHVERSIPESFHRSLSMKKNITNFSSALFSVVQSRIANPLLQPTPTCNTRLKILWESRFIPTKSRPKRHHWPLNKILNEHFIQHIAINSQLPKSNKIILKKISTKTTRIDEETSMSERRGDVWNRRRLGREKNKKNHQRGATSAATRENTTQQQHHQTLTETLNEFNLAGRKSGK